eukprot:14627_1
MSNKRGFVVGSRGFIDVTILEYDFSSQRYEIEIEDALLVSANDGKIRLQMHAKHVNQLILTNNHTICAESITSSIDDTNLNDSEIDHVLDEILESDEENTESTSYGNQDNPYLLTVKEQLDPQTIGSIWSDICNISRSTTCMDSVDKCHCIQRIVFLLKWYHLWCEYIGMDHEPDDYLSSMTSFFSILDEYKYNRIELINDFVHVHTLHHNEQLHTYTHSIIQDDAQDALCPFIDRMRQLQVLQHNEVYKQSTSEYDDGLGIIKLYNVNRKNIEHASMDEMMEINLESYLDTIHCNLLHNAISNGHKYIHTIPAHYTDEMKETHGVIEVGAYEFGHFFNYWSAKNDHFCAPKYKNVKKELLSNALYCISVHDYAMIEHKATDLLHSQIGKQWVVQREFQWMKTDALSLGQTMSIERLIALITYCNYNDMRTSFQHLGCGKVQKSETYEAVKDRHKEIAHWCRTLMEIVYCFGDVLAPNNKLYHGLDCKLSFHRMDFEFDLPLSMTSNLSVFIDHGYGTDDTDGICLQFERMYNRDICNLYLDLGMLSLFPADGECIVFGAKFKCTDLIWNGFSHEDQVIALCLYQKLICGEWFKDNERYLLQEKYQCRITNMALKMMNMNSVEWNSRYIPYLFESITKNVSFGRKMIWINQNELQYLLPLLKQLLCDRLAKYILNTFNITTKFCDVFHMNIRIKKDLDHSSRKKNICSQPYKYPEKNIVLQCRCFKQYSKIKQDVMFNAYLGIKSMPKHISLLKVYGGIAIPQIEFEKWNYFYLSHEKMNNGGALFSTRRFKDIKRFKLNICFQIWSIVDLNEKSTKVH